MQEDDELLLQLQDAGVPHPQGQGEDRRLHPGAEAELAGEGPESEGAS